MREMAKAAMIGLALSFAACAPTVSVQGGDKPIVINLNVKIEQEVRVKVEKDADSLIKSNPGLF
jgi:YnbE-like lipoprotein